MYVLEVGVIREEGEISKTILATCLNKVCLYV